MKKFFKSAALVLAAAVVMAFASCSLDSSEDEFAGYSLLIDNQEVTISEEWTLQEFIPASTFSEKGYITELKIVLKNYKAVNTDWDPIKITPAKDWDKQINLFDGKWTGMEGARVCTYTLNGDALAAFRSNGLYIASAKGVTATFSVYYITGEAPANNSNNNNASNENTKTATITGTTVSFTSDEALQTIFADQLADYNITAMTVSAKLDGSADGAWWAGITNPAWADLSWNANPAVEGYNYELIADSDLISYAKSNGIWIKANPGLTAEVKLTITYTE